MKTQMLSTILAMAITLVCANQAAAETLSTTPVNRCAAVKSLLSTKFVVVPELAIHETGAGGAANDDPVGCCCLKAGSSASCGERTEKACKKDAQDASVDYTWKEGKCSSLLSFITR